MERPQLCVELRAAAEAAAGARETGYVLLGDAIASNAPASLFFMKLMSFACVVCAQNVYVQ